MWNTEAPPPFLVQCTAQWPSGAEDPRLVWYHISHIRMRLSIQTFISQSSSFIWICSFGIVPTVQLYQTESVPPLSVELSIKASVSSISLVHAANRCIHRVNGAMVATERRLGRGNRTQRGRNKCRKIFLLYACPRTHKMFTVSHSTLGWSLVTGDWRCCEPSMVCSVYIAGVHRTQWHRFIPQTC